MIIQKLRLIFSIHIFGGLEIKFNMHDQPSEYEIRKAMLEAMDDKELSSIIFNKKREASAIRVEEFKIPILTALSDRLELPFDLVFNTYLAELRSECNNVIDILSKELKRRKYSDKNTIDLEELKASVPIADVVRYYIPSYSMKR